MAHNNALLALLVSNNFAEIKSNVFKRFSKDNVHNIVYSGKLCGHTHGIFSEIVFLEKHKQITFLKYDPKEVVM